MKKRILSVLLAAVMILGLMPATVLAADTSTAPELIRIGGIELTNGKYLATNDATYALNYTTGASYVALYKDGVLYLNGLNITKNTQCIWWNYSSSGKDDLVVELAEGSVNTLVRTNGAAINGENGWASGGPCLTIRGNGTLNVTGSSYGIWVWEDVIVEGGVVLNATGGTGAAISNNCSKGSIVVKQGASIVATGGTYGVESDNGASSVLSVLGGSFTATGGTSALELPADFSGNTVYVGNSAADAQSWDGSTALTSYKYISLSGFSSTVTTYNVAKAPTSNGSFEVDYEKSMADETVTISATPASGYEIDTVTVTDADSGSVTVNGTGTTRSFTMPEKDVTVAVSFKAKAAPAVPTNHIVHVGGVGMGDGSVTTYYVNGAAAAVTVEPASYNAKLETVGGVLTLTLKNFAYEGEKNGVRSTANLKLVLTGDNTIRSTKNHVASMPTNEAHGVFVSADLIIEGTAGSSLDVHSANANAIMTYNTNQRYAESITVIGANITATAGGDVGIVATESLSIKNSVISATGDYHGLQGGGFTSSVPTSITVENSTITAVSTLGSGVAFKSAPIVNEAYQWRAQNGEWVAFRSNDATFTSAKYVELKPGTPAAPLTYAVTVVNGTGSGQYEKDKTVTITADAPATGYKFTGWTTEDGVTFANAAATTTAFAMPEKAVTVKANYAPDTFTLTFDTDGGSTIAPITQDYNTVVTAPAAPTKTGYTFAGWDKAIPTTMPAESVTIKALWTINQYTITFDTDGGSTIAPITQDYNTAVTAPAAPTKTGYTFAGWDKTIPTTMPAENVTIKALWTINQYTITFETNGGSAIAPITQDYNSAVTKPADPVKLGYDFGGWYADAALTTAYVFNVIPADNITVYAKWTPASGIAYTVKHYHQNTSGSGYTLYESATLRGTTENQTAAEAKNYPGFTALTFAQTTILPDGSAVVEIKYDRNVYPVTLVTNDGTVLNGNVTAYTYGVGATLPVNVEKNGYVFKGWYDNEACYGTPVTAITATDLGSKTFYAKWEMDVTMFLPLLLKHKVFVAENIGGVVTADKYEASAGGRVTLTVLPKDGYELKSVTVTDAKGTPVAVTNAGNGTFFFTMPMKDVTVFAAFTALETPGCPQDKTCPITAYTDANAKEWYHDGVHYCIENGLMKGYEDGTFQPATATSRAMIVTVLWRLEGSPVANYAMSFADVDQDAWYAEAIRWAAAQKIVEGYSDDAFGPDDAITREQLAAILYRYEQYKGGGFKGTWMFRLDYTDLTEISDWATEAMYWCSMNHVIEGKPGKLLDPCGNATRAEAATMLHRYCTLSDNNNK